MYIKKTLYSNYFIKINIFSKYQLIGIIKNWKYNNNSHSVIIKTTESLIYSNY